MTQDAQKSSEVFLQGVCYTFCTSTKITLKTPIQHLSYFTKNNMNCVVGALLFGSLDLLMVILLWTRTVQLQEIIQNSPIQTVTEQIIQQYEQE